MVQGSNFQLRADVAPERLADREVRWTSSDPSVATVSATGLVEAVGPGNAALSLTGVELITQGARTISVVASQDLVAGASPEASAFTQLVFDPLPASVDVNGTVEVTAWLVGPEAGRVAATEVSWTSSDTGVLASTGGGRFRAVGPGAATIVASHEGSDLTQRAQLSVSAPAPVQTATPPPAQPDPRPPEPQPSRIAIQGSGGPLELGQTRGLSAQVVDEAGRPMSGSQVQWFSSAPDRVTVGSDGRVSAVAEGSSWVVASSGSLRDSMLVTATAPAPPPPPDPATLSATEVSSLVDRIAGLLESERHSEVLDLIPAGEREAHERYLTVLQDGRLRFDGPAQGISVNGSTVTFTVAVRSRTSFGGTREGAMQFAAELDAPDGNWRIVRLVPAAGSDPP
ncbi:MAG: hypothetical protein HKN73_00255 [Gemmatimonadetes bacterium]|nr:hypothetical protein [Gemmatimonadota bacterium]